MCGVDDGVRRRLRGWVYEQRRNDEECGGER